jgi:phosphomannomutase
MDRYLDFSVTGRENLDGVKIYLDDFGWLLVRASGTEPMLRLYSETPKTELTRRILDETAAFVQNL